jgi:hypothetical protein
MRPFKEQYYYFWKKLAERQSRKHYSNHYKAEIEKFNNSKNKKPASQISSEKKALARHWGCYPFQYIRYEMYKADCQLTLDEMKAYIPNYFAYYLFFPKFFTSYGILTEDKSLTNSFFKAYNVRQPELLFKFAHNRFLDGENNQLPSQQVDELIKASGAEKLFVKPTFGLGGRGILVFNLAADGYRNSENELLSASFISNQLKNEHYIVQKGLIQHEEISKIYPKAINTFRIMTKVENGKGEIIYSMLRMGQKGNQIDNASQHGLACAVNKENGKFASQGFTGLREAVTSHPDTGFKFDGYQFPYWDELKQFIVGVAEKFYEIKYLGWDVAFTADGPAIIEINAGAGLEFLQDCYGGVADGFEVGDPGKWWYSKKYFIKDE